MGDNSSNEYDNILELNELKPHNRWVLNLSLR